MFSRRDMLAATAVGGVVTAATMTGANADPVITPVKSDISFGNPNDPPQGAINAKNPRSISDPGPQNPAIRDQFPHAFSPPATDVGSMPLIVQQRATSHSKWRLGAPGDARLLRGCRHHLRRQHAADSRWHPRDALAPVCRVGLHDLRHLPDHHSRRIGPALYRRREG